jgi:ferritin-like protein
MDHLWKQIQNAEDDVRVAESRWYANHFAGQQQDADFATHTKIAAGLQARWDMAKSRLANVKAGLPANHGQAPVVDIEKIIDARLAAFADDLTAGFAEGMVTFIRLQFKEFADGGKSDAFEGALRARFNAMHAEIDEHVRKRAADEARAQANLINNRMARLEKTLNETFEKGILEALGSRLAELEQRGLKYVGVYQRTNVYHKGDVVTHGGNGFVAVADVVAEGEVPMTSDSWQMFVKKGRDGKDATTR